VFEVRQWLVNKFVFNDGATNVDFRELAVVYQNVGTISLGFEHGVHWIEEVSNDHVVQLKVVVAERCVFIPVFAIDEVKQRVGASNLALVSQPLLVKMKLTFLVFIFFILFILIEIGYSTLFKSRVNYLAALPSFTQALCPKRQYAIYGIKHNVFYPSLLKDLYIKPFSYFIIYSHLFLLI